MSAIGTWKLKIDTPMGTRTSSITLIQEGGTYKGSLSGDSGSTDLEDVTIDGATVSFKADVPSPMGQLKVTVNGTVDGDSLTGNMETSYGAMPFTGERE